MIQKLAMLHYEEEVLKTQRVVITTVNKRLRGLVEENGTEVNSNSDSSQSEDPRSPEREPEESTESEVGKNHAVSAKF